MPDAISLHHLRWRKKKVDGFIIPANHFYGRVLELPVKSPEIVEALDVPQAGMITASIDGAETVTTNADGDADVTKSGTVEIQIVQQNAAPTLTENKISALSLNSIRAKKELEQATKAATKDDVHLPTEAFNETDMLLQWTKYAQRLSDKGHKIMESLMLISDPKLKGSTIIHELPNESAKIDFESGRHELLGYLRGKLHNHDIDLQIVVNESIDSRKAFTPQDRYNRLNEINPTLDLLRKTFDLDF